jgi:penicillin-binding protein 1A
MANDNPPSSKSGLSPQKIKRFKRLTWILVYTPILVVAILFSLAAFNVVGDLPNVEELQNPKSNLATVVYSSDGKTLGKYYLENRTNIRYKDLNPEMVNALIATEDARFREHSGVDLKAMFGSAKGLVTGNLSRGGGSTITQQLAKMQFPREENMGKIRFFFRKLQEWVIAIRLEKLYTKDEIITMYLNKFDFLNQAVGVNSAAQIYFNTTPAKLKTEECAMLVGMAKNPAIFNPHKASRVDTTTLRRNVVMKQMVKYGFLKQHIYDSLQKLPITLHFMPEDHNEGPAPYFREYLRSEFLDDWCSKHINPETGKPYNIYKDGLKIYTTLDSRMQKYAEEAVDEHMHALQDLFIKDCKKKKNAPFAWNVNKEQIEKIMTDAMHRSERWKSMKEAGVNESDRIANFKTPIKMTVYSNRGDIDTVMTPWDSIRYYKGFLQTGFLALEPETGYVKAWVGGINHRHFKYDHVQKGHGRQVGSTFKPFVYALAIQEGSSPCELIPNVKTCIPTAPGQPDWCPENSDGKKGTGVNITLQRGLALSINYVTAALMKRYGPQAVVDLVKRMGITSPIDPVPSICLGTPDISVIEMVGANSTFANKGRWVEPVFVTRIEDRNGKVLEDFVPKSTEVFSEEKAYVMTQLMKGVVLYGTGARLRGKYKLTNPIAGKTGTTQNNADGWFMGLTPELVAGCWVGGEDRSVHFNSTAEGQGASMALPIWGKFFQKVYADKTIKISKGDFYRPANMGEVEMDCSSYDQGDGNVFDSDNGEDDPFDNL